MHAANVSTSPRLQRVLGFLSDGGEHSTLEIITGAQVCAVNSCVAELRDNGYDITCRQADGGSRGERVWLYQLQSQMPLCR